MTAPPEKRFFSKFLNGVIIRAFFFLSKEERDFSLRVIDWMGENKREGILFFLLLGSEQQFGYAYNAFYGLSDSMLEAC